MSRLGTAVQRYLDIRRGLGTQLRGVDGVYRSFVAFADQHHRTHVTPELVLQWLRPQTRVAQSTRADRYRLIRRFAVWHSASEPRTRVPPEGLVAGRYQRQAPYIYRADELLALLHAAQTLAPPTALRGHTYATLLGLLCVTGMRVSEVLALDRDDVRLDAAEMILRVRHTKFDKSRLIPLHPTTAAALAAYAQRRDQLIRRPRDPAFFLSDHGTRLNACTLHYHFARLSQRVGLRPPAAHGRHGRGPRLHDLRHRLVVQTLIGWYRSGVDVERELPKLSVYLGHAHVNDTYWYIQAVPELLQLAADRLAARTRAVSP
jgi:integrase